MSPEAEVWYSWVCAMLGATAALKLHAPSEYQKMLDWRRDNVDGSGDKGTSDWPGWVPLIGPPPDLGGRLVRPARHHRKGAR